MKNLIAFPFAVLFGTAIVLPVNFWEAYVALKIWGWHVPQTLPSWVTVWTLGWMNLAVSVMIRQARFRSKEEVEQKPGQYSAQMFQFGYVAPAVALGMAWLVNVWLTGRVW